MGTHRYSKTFRLSTEKKSIIMEKNKISKIFINIAKIICIIACLYLFICSLDVLSTSFKLLAGKATGDIFNAKWLNNPLVGLMIGVLGTVLVQSSSTFTSIIVAAIGAGMDVQIAVPMLMGANIGTSVTNTLVAMTQIGNRDEFERAFAAATVHDMFNWSTVILLFTVECLMGTHFLERMTDSIANGLVGKDIKGAKKIKILGHLTDPLTDSIIDIDKGVLKKWASKEACVDCRLIVEDSNYLFNLPNLSDQVIGGILLLLSLIVLCVSLFIMVKVLNSLLQGPVAIAVKKFVNPKFNNPVGQYLYGYFNIALGAGCTICVQSSSVFTSTLTPMVGIGLVEVENVYPLFLGSNIGTTFTAMLAALAQPSKDTIQGALVHLFYNLIGILIFYPIPFLRFPIPLCKKLGKITATYRWFAIVYVVGMFFVMPGFFVLLTMIDSKGITMYTFMLIIFVIITGSMTINWMQSNTKPVNELLPEKLRNWDFLPEPLKSFEPYDRLLTGCSCCPTADDLEAQKIDEVELQEQKSSGIDNPSMDYKQF